MKSIDTLLDEIRIKKLLVIFPHPDDETVMTAGMIQRVKSKEWGVEVVCLSAGEAGQIHTDGDKKRLGEIRKNEMRAAMKILKVDTYKVLDFTDGKLRQSIDWKKWMKTHIDWRNYGLVVTYDHSGISGHPDHISVSREVKSQLESEEDKVRPILIWVSMSGRPREVMVNKKVLKNLVVANLRLSMNMREVWLKWKALRSHASQRLGRKWWVPNLVLLLIFRNEYFAEVAMEKKYPYKYIDFKI